MNAIMKFTLAVATTAATAYGGISGFEQPSVQTKCNGANVMRYGFMWVYSAPIDVAPVKTWQEGNSNPVEKIKVKDSSKIKSNYIGVNSRMIHDETRDEYPEQPVHLIDGDITTCWMSKCQIRSDVQPSWVRLDLAKEETISKIILKKRPKNPGARRPECDRMPSVNGVEIGRGMPVKMDVKISRDAYAWESVFSGETKDTDDKESFEISFTPRKAKQIWVRADKLRVVEFFMYSFSLSEIEVLNEKGENVALVSRGTGVSASSTYHTEGLTRAEQRGVWPILWDSGIKWVRFGYHDDPVNWHWVEREKGKLEIDPITDEAITSMAERGIDVIIALGFGNRLYSGPEGRSFPQLCEWNWNMPKPPTTPEALEAWDRYVIFMCKHFADRVKVFEIWNEWNIGVYFGAESNYEDYARIAERTIPLIRKYAPKAKVSLGAVSGFPGRKWASMTAEQKAAREAKSMELKVMRRFAKEVDAMGFHPFYNPKPGRFKDYTADLKAFDAWTRECGFKGELMPSEWNVNCVYPCADKEAAPDIWCGTYSPTELQRAKEILNVYLRHAGLNMPSMFCEMAGTYYTQTNLSFFRLGFHADPISQVQPDASYYALRNLSNLTDGWMPEAIAASVAPKLEGLETFTFKTEKGKAVSIWIESAEKTDEIIQKPVTVEIAGESKNVYLADPLNGTVQKAIFANENGKTVVKNVFVGDFPTLVVCE